MWWRNIQGLQPVQSSCRWKLQGCSKHRSTQREGKHLALMMQITSLWNPGVSALQTVSSIWCLQQKSDLCQHFWVIQTTTKVLFRHLHLLSSSLQRGRKGSLNYWNWISKIHLQKGQNATDLSHRSPESVMSWPIFLCSLSLLRQKFC